MTADDADEAALSLALPWCPSYLHPLTPHPKLTAWLCGHCGLVRL